MRPSKRGLWARASMVGAWWAELVCGENPPSDSDSDDDGEDDAAPAVQGGADAVELVEGVSLATNPEALLPNDCPLCGTLLQIYLGTEAYCSLCLVGLFMPPPPHPPRLPLSS